jgi:endonuclease/exonuclease/phosphatase family metal-dependent hydrolase
MEKSKLVKKFKKHINNNQTNFIEKNKKSVRIMTYNVNNWKNTDDEYTLKEIFDVIKDSDSDIVLFNEAMFFTNKIREDFNLIQQKSKYKYIEMCSTKFGINIILSVFPIKEKKVICLGKDPIRKINRYAIKASIDIGKKENLNIILTHLDVFDETEDTRLKQIKMIYDNIDTKYIIIGDLNSLRKDDYDENEWKKMIKNDKLRNIELQNKVADFIESKNFVDSFVSINKSIQVSVWSMRRVDYFYIGKDFTHKLIDSNVYYTDKSDHLPLYIDILAI